MMTDKQSLLKCHRRKKRIGVTVFVLVLLGAGAFWGWWLPLLLAIPGWLVHEVWLSDHLFYSPRQDYDYRFPVGSKCVPAVVESDGVLTLSEASAIGPTDTLFLALELKANLLGRFFDPCVILTAGGSEDVQAFERNSKGLRYINLTGFAAAIRAGSFRIGTRHCRISGSGRLWVFNHPDYLQKRLLVIAPHADDAELAAFGLYSQARESWIVTLTAGETEAGHYRRMGHSATEAALMKGRLRSWDSVTVPRWGGVPEKNCIQLGYFCLQLPAMQGAPDNPAGSREADLCDTRPFRAYNQITLPSDHDGSPTWDHLNSDLQHILELVRPEVIVLPHPQLDPHPDHVCAYDAVISTLTDSTCRPEALLCYANHLHDNDRWPMGDAHAGVPLPPQFAGETIDSPYCLVTDHRAQQDKAMALGMMHDLQAPLPFKKRLRRGLQSIFTGRRWPPYGENEFFRKAVRRHELFWVRYPAVPVDRQGGSAGQADPT